jgi:hypothetical protein
VRVATVPTIGGEHASCIFVTARRSA